MKNCNEMVHSLLERREQYEAKKRTKRKKLIKILTPICSFFFVALLGIGAWQVNMFEKQPIQTVENTVVQGTKDQYEANDNEPQNSNSVNTRNAASSPSQTNNDFYDMLGMIVYHNETYIQTFSITEEDIELDEKIGNGDDFEGFYKNSEIGSEIYTVKNDSDLLAVVLENGGFVILKKENDSYFGQSATPD